MSKITRRIITLALAAISLYTVFRYTGSTTVWWILLTGILILLVYGKKQFYNDKNNPNLLPIKLYLLWNIICIIRGAFVASDYWEWKFYVQTSIVMLVPLCVFVFTNTFVVQKVVQQWFRYLLPLFFVIYIFIDGDVVGHYLMPGGFLLLFFPFLTNKWRVVGLIMAFIVFYTNLGARSNVIKFVIPLLLSAAYFLKVLFHLKVLKASRIVFMILPLVLLYLGLTKVFNIFKMNEYIEGNYKYGRSDIEGAQDDLTTDTRTFLYVEVITSALKYDYVMLGRTPARGNESEHFGPGIDDDLGTNKMERHANEVNVLNIFTWTGVIGLVLYFLIFFKATYLALYKSKSRIMQILGIYVAFRWTYGWVEDFSSFNLSYLFLWISISMCLSEDFRSMRDEDFKNWVRGMFDSKYRRAIVRKTKVSLQSPHSPVQS